MTDKDTEAAFRILALDGGGIRGLFQACFLEQIERQRKIEIQDSCSLLTGTSVGAIIAIALGVGYSANNISMFFRDLGPNVFGGRWRQLLRWSPVEARFASCRLRSETSRFLKEVSFSECRPVTLVTTTVLNSHESHLFASDDTGDEPPSAVDVAMASSAAPTFFRPCTIGLNTYVDGGFWANNPALAAVNCAVARGISPERLRILSLGTGHVIQSERVRQIEKGGKVAWLRTAMQLLFDSQSHSVDFLLRRVACRFGCYERIDPPLNKAIALDDHAAALAHLPSLAERLARDDDCRAKIARWLS